MERDEQRVRRCTNALSIVHLDARCCRLPPNALMRTGSLPVLGDTIARPSCTGALAVIAPYSEQERAGSAWIPAFAPMPLGYRGHASEAVLPVLAVIARCFGPPRARTFSQSTVSLRAQLRRNAA